MEKPEIAVEIEQFLLGMPIEDERTEIQQQRDEFMIRFTNRCEGMLQYFQMYFEKRPKPMEREQKVDWSAVEDCSEQIRRVRALKDGVSGQERVRIKEQIVPKASGGMNGYLFWRSMSTNI